jgi:hypothetical protein
VSKAKTDAIFDVIRPKPMTLIYGYAMEDIPDLIFAEGAAFGP